MSDRTPHLEELTLYIDVVAKTIEADDQVSRLLKGIYLAGLAKLWSDYFNLKGHDSGSKGWAIKKLRPTIEEIRHYLKCCARKEKYTSYRKVEEKFPREDGMGWAAHQTLLGHVLGVISTESLLEEDLMLSVLVQNQKGESGKSFNDLARKLGNKNADMDWHAETERFFEEYRNYTCRTRTREVYGPSN